MVLITIMWLAKEGSDRYCEQSYPENVEIQMKIEIF